MPPAKPKGVQPKGPSGRRHTLIFDKTPPARRSPRYTNLIPSRHYSDTTPDVAITYTRFGAQKTVTDATGTRTFTYTTALRPDQEQLPAYYGDRLLNRSYDVATNVSSGMVAGRLFGEPFSVNTA